MSDKDAARLLALLAAYAEAYGLDCDGDVTVKEMADDIVDSNTDPVLSTEVENLRDRVYDGLNQHR